MFHTAGYFRGVSCPFFEHGLCHRPHCHFKHAKPKSTAQRKLPKLHVKHFKFTSVGEKSARDTPSSDATVERDKERDLSLSVVTKTSKTKKHDQVKPVSVSHFEVTSAGGVQEGGKEDEIQSKGDVLTSEVGVAIGQLTNFFGSNELTGIDEVGASVMVMSAPEVTSEEITVTDSVPSYAPEKCEVECPGKGSSEVIGTGSSRTDAVIELGVSELENMLVTEHDIFGSPEEEAGQEWEGIDDQGDLDMPTPSKDEKTLTVQEDVTSSVEDLERMEAEFKRITSQGAVEDWPHLLERKRKTLEAESSIIDPAAKKRRVAHSNVQMVREPARVTPKALVIKSDFSSTMEPSALYLGKKRIAAIPAPSSVASTTAPSVTRPKLPLTPNAKIPTNIRQKFLNAFIDEHLKMTASPQEAYDKSLEEEQALFNRSNRRMIYMNLCTLSLKKLREKVDQFLLEERKRSDARVEALLRSEVTEGEQKSVSKRESRDKDGHRKNIKKKKKRIVSSMSVDDSSPAGERKSGVGTKSWESLEAELQATFSSKPALSSSSTMISDKGVSSKKEQRDGTGHHVGGDLSEGIHKIREKTNVQVIDIGTESVPISSETSGSHDTSSYTFKSCSQFYSEKTKKLKQGLKSGHATTTDPGGGVRGSLKHPPQHLAGTPQSSITTVEGQRSAELVEDMTTELFGESGSSSDGLSDEGDNIARSGVSDNDGGHSGMSFESALASVDSSRPGIKTKKILRPKMRHTSTSSVKGRHTPGGHREKGGVVKVKRKANNRGQSLPTESKQFLEHKVQRSMSKTSTPTTEGTCILKKTRVQSSSDNDYDLNVGEHVDHKGQSSSPEDVNPLKSPLLELGKVPVLKLVRIQSPPQTERKLEKPVLHLSSTEHASTSTDLSSVTEEGEPSLPSPSTPLPSSPLTPSFLPSGPFINLTRVAAAQQKKSKMATTMSAETREQLNKIKELKKKKKKAKSGTGVPSGSNVRAKPSVCVLKKKEIELTLKTLFVDANSGGGGDSNSGTMTSPFKTTTEAVDAAAVFVERLKAYLLTEDQLVENGYPRPMEEVGVASINRGGGTPPIIESVGSNAVRHRCCRCNKPFIIYNHGQYQTVEECVYHYGRLVKMKEYGEGIVSKYTCCQERRDSAGCQVAKLHVTAGDKPTRDVGYVMTTPPPESAVNRKQAAYALDCEMCYTTVGLELTRVTVVDVNMIVAYEAVVKPGHPIVDCNTRFSGLTADDFVGVTTTLRDVQDRLLQLFHEDTILLGHSLESDLRSLKIIHSSVVDTAIVFPHRKGLPFKRALKTLMAEYLLKFIQDNIDGGHDSLEDSKACMELMMWKVKGDLKKAARRVPGV